MTARDALALVVLVISLGGATWMSCSLAVEGWRGFRKWMDSL